MAARARIRTLRNRIAGVSAVVLAISAASAFLPACKPGREPGGGRKNVTVAVTPWPGSASVYIAQDKGYFREQGLEVALHSYASGNRGLDDLVSGKADIATASETPIARAALEGKPVSVLATVSRSDRVYRVVGRKDRGIATPGDLVGKKVGRVGGSGAAYYLEVFLSISNVAPDDVRIVSLEPDRIVPALLAGEVDAVCTWPPHSTVLEGRLGANAASLSEQGLFTMTWNVVARRSLVQENPDVIVRFLRALVRAGRFIEERPAEALSITADHAGMDVAALEKEWRDYHTFVGLDQSLLLLMEDQARWMIERRNPPAPRVPDFLEVVASDGLKAVAPDSVDIPGE